jgi:hypothetical protein
MGFEPKLSSPPDSLCCKPRVSSFIQTTVVISEIKPADEHPSCTWLFHCYIVPLGTDSTGMSTLTATNYHKTWSPNTIFYCVTWQRSVVPYMPYRTTPRRPIKWRCVINLYIQGSSGTYPWSNVFRDINGIRPGFDFGRGFFFVTASIAGPRFKNLLPSGTAAGTWNWLSPSPGVKVTNV